MPSRLRIGKTSAASVGFALPLPLPLPFRPRRSAPPVPAEGMGRGGGARETSGRRAAGRRDHRMQQCSLRRAEHSSLTSDRQQKQQHQLQTGIRLSGSQAKPCAETRRGKQAGEVPNFANPSLCTSVHLQSFSFAPQPAAAPGPASVQTFVFSYTVLGLRDFPLFYC